MQNLSFKYKNVSGKSIVFTAISLLIKSPERQNRALVRLTPDKALEALPPDAEMTYTVNASTLARMLKNMGVTNLESTVELDLGSIRFNDNTSWGNGVTRRRDANNPKLWRRVAETGMGEKPPTIKATYLKGKSLARQACYQADDEEEFACGYGCFSWDQFTGAFPGGNYQQVVDYAECDTQYGSNCGYSVYVYRLELDDDCIAE